MQQGLATILQVVIGSSVGAGVVTFFLNFWKAERDFRRAKLEELYAAVHEYTKLVSWISPTVRTGRFDTSEEQSKANESMMQVDLINLLVDLYFPQLKGIFESFRNMNENFMFKKSSPLENQEQLKEDFLKLVKEGNNLKRAVIDLAHRKRILLAWRINRTGVLIR